MLDGLRLTEIAIRKVSVKREMNNEEAMDFEETSGARYVTRTSTPILEHGYITPREQIIVAQILGGKMDPDYDLSNLETSQVDLWIQLELVDIFSQMKADQPERRAFAHVIGGCIISAVTEKPQAALDNRKLGADPWARLRDQN